MKQAPSRLCEIYPGRHGIKFSSVVLNVYHHAQIVCLETSVDLPQVPLWAPVRPVSRLRVSAGASAWTLGAPAGVQGTLGGNILAQHHHTILHVTRRRLSAAGAGPTLLEGQTPLHVEHHRGPKCASTQCNSNYIVLAIPNLFPESSKKRKQTVLAVLCSVMPVKASSSLLKGQILWVFLTDKSIESSLRVRLSRAFPSFAGTC